MSSRKKDNRVDKILLHDNEKGWVKYINQLSQNFVSFYKIRHDVSGLFKYKIYDKRRNFTNSLDAASSLFFDTIGGFNPSKQTPEELRITLHSFAKNYNFAFGRKNSISVPHSLGRSRTSLLETFLNGEGGEVLRIELVEYSASKHILFKRDLRLRAETQDFNLRSWAHQSTANDIEILAAIVFKDPSDDIIAENLFSAMFSKKVSPDRLQLWIDKDFENDLVLFKMFKRNVLHKINFMNIEVVIKDDLSRSILDIPDALKFKTIQAEESHKKQLLSLKLENYAGANYIAKRAVNMVTELS